MGRERIIKRLCQSCGNQREAAPIELIEGAQCRFCKAPVRAIAEPMPVDGKTLETIAASLDVPVLVDIQWPETPEDRSQQLQLERVGRKLDGRGVILRLDAEDEREAAWALGVTTVPTMLLMKRGNVVFQWEGVAEAELIQEWMRIAYRL
jgi:thioredoxin 2